MADDVRITAMPNRDNGSPERVALDLLARIVHKEAGYTGKKEILDLYAECLLATRGYRDI